MKIIYIDYKVKKKNKNYKQIPLSMLKKNICAQSRSCCI